MPETILQKLKSDVERADTWVQNQLPKWQRNVEYRVNKVLDTDPERDEVLVPVDWARTRNKIAQLFFQVPKITLFPRAPQWRPVTPLTSAVINYQLAEEIHAEIAMEEALGDAVNAAGFGAIFIDYQAQFVPQEVPAVDLSARNPDELVSLVAQNGGQVPMTTVQKPIYQKIEWVAIDPADFRFPLRFNKSNFQKAPWLAFRFRMSKAEARRRKWMPDDDKGSIDAPKSVNATYEENLQRDSSTDDIGGLRLWYRPHLYDPNESDCRKLKMVIWLDDVEKPVVHEDCTWQRYVPETREWVGITAFPIKVCTLSHVSGMAIPPSDSEMGRPQVRELNRTRTQMMQQRDRSQPLRWYDVNLVDEEIVEQIRRGTWQDMIPTQGPGNNVIGEVARAAYPRESWEFERVLSTDIDNAWSMGPNQGGYEASGSTSATEAEITQRNFQVALEFQRAKVLKWFLEGAQATLDLIQMFFEIEQWVPFTKPGGEKALEVWDRTKVPGKYVMSARPDAATRVDVSQRRAESLNRYKLLRNDPLANGQKLLADVFEAHDVDPTEGFAPPPPPQEQRPKPASFSFKGEDLVNPIAVALIQKSTPLTPQEIQAARIMMADAGIPVAPTTTLPDATQTHPETPQNDASSGESQKHPGITSEVTPLNRRYEQGSGEGPNEKQGMIGEDTGKV